MATTSSDLVQDLKPKGIHFQTVIDYFVDELAYIGSATESNEKLLELKSLEVTRLNEALKQKEEENQNLKEQLATALAIIDNLQELVALKYNSSRDQPAQAQASNTGTTFLPNISYRSRDVKGQNDEKSLVPNIESIKVYSILVVFSALCLTSLWLQVHMTKCSALIQSTIQLPSVALWHGVS
jgi:hypothetical protein